MQALLVFQLVHIASRVGNAGLHCIYTHVCSLNLVSQRSQCAEFYLGCKQSGELGILCSQLCQLLSGFALLHTTVTNTSYALHSSYAQHTLKKHLYIFPCRLGDTWYPSQSVQAQVAARQAKP